MVDKIYKEIEIGDFILHQASHRIALVVGFTKQKVRVRYLFIAVDNGNSINSVWYEQSGLVDPDLCFCLSLEQTTHYINNCEYAQAPYTLEKLLQMKEELL